MKVQHVVKVTPTIVWLPVVGSLLPSTIAFASREKSMLKS